MKVKSRDSEVVKKMAEYIKAGAALTSYTCPACGTPLLKLKTGEIYCVNCGKRVYVVKSDIEERGVVTGIVLEELRNTITSLLSNLVEVLKRGDVDTSERIELGREILVWLEALERVNRLLREVGSGGSS